MQPMGPVLALLAAIAPKAFVVDTRGSDFNDGSAAHPFATIGKAVDASREGDCVIRIHKGRYFALGGLVLKSDNVRIEADPGAVLTGSVIVPGTDVEPDVLSRLPEVARSHVREIKLDPNGAEQFLMPRGFAKSTDTGPCELFVGGKPQHLAQWPNEGFLKTGDVLQGAPDTGKPGVFKFDSDRPSHWKSPLVWAYGYWRWDWADEAMPVESIKDGTVSLASSHVYGFVKGAKFRFENVVEEIDQPGEYAVEPGRAILWPSSDGPIELSVTMEPLLTIRKAKNVSVSGLRFENARGRALSIEDSKGCSINRCVFRNTGLEAAKVQGGSDTTFHACRVEDTGEGGFRVDAGDRLTLTPCHDIIENCVFTRFMRRARTYRPAVLIHGIGVTVRYCDFSDAPHSAIIFGGNDHVIEHNDFHDLLSDTGDGGVVYAGRDWSARGTVIRENLFVNDVGLHQWENCVYLDDQLSGERVERNVFAGCHWGMLVGGGQDNVVRNNLILDCKLGFSLDARGLGWAASSFDTMKKNLEAVPYQSSAWKARYPQLAGILEDKPMAPLRNDVSDNVLMRSGHMSDRLEKPFADGSTLKGNLESDVDPGFARLGRGFKLSNAALKLVEGVPGCRDMASLKFGPRFAVPGE